MREQQQCELYERANDEPVQLGYGVNSEWQRTVDMGLYWIKRWDNCRVFGSCKCPELHSYPFSGVRRNNKSNYAADGKLQWDWFIHSNP